MVEVTVVQSARLGRELASAVGVRDHFAPSAAASSTAAARFANEFELASTRMILQFWQIACAISTSSEVSSAQPASLRGYELVPPVWLTLMKQAFASEGEVQVGRSGMPYVWLYTLRSLRIVGSS